MKSSLKRLLTLLAVISFYGFVLPLFASSEAPVVCGSSEYRFVISRGEFFPQSSPGELSELTLSGYFFPGDKPDMKVLSPFSAANSYTLTGSASINGYSPGVQSGVVASLSLPTLCAPSGLYLTVVIDGLPMNVRLPYPCDSDILPSGFIYTYRLEVDGRSLIVSGVSVLPLDNLRKE